MNIQKAFEDFKAEVREISKEEVSLKSISFSKVQEDTEELICYFAWKQTEKNLTIYRNNFREIVKKIARKYFLIFNRKKSTATKFIFQPMPIELVSRLEQTIKTFKDNE